MSNALVSTHPDDVVAQKLPELAYAFVTSAGHDIHIAAMQVGITPLLGRSMQKLKAWHQALEQARQSRIIELVGSGRGLTLTALQVAAEMLTTHPQDEFLALASQGPVTHAMLNEGLSRVAKDCIKSIRTKTLELPDADGVPMPIEIIDGVQFDLKKWDTAIRILDAQGIKGAKLMPTDGENEVVEGFGGIQINFVREVVP